VNLSNTIKIRAAVPALLILLIPFARAQERWKIQYFYDKPDAVFNIRDLACPSAQHCLAVGAIVDLNGKSKGATVTTSDAGQHWNLEDFSEEPVSLFMPNENMGWIVTDRGIWASVEGGRSWKKLANLKGIVDVHFLDEQHGFAIGYPEAIYETTDGGVKWSKVSEAQTPPAKPEDVIYDCIAFDGPQGVIAGHLLTEKNRRYPTWLVPNAERVLQQQQSVLFLLQTLDGGKTWKFSSNAVVGNITAFRFTKEDSVLALVEYHDMYELPSAVVKIKLGTLGTQTIFGERDRAVSDVALLPGGGGMITAVEPPGNTNQVPIPGKLKILRSKDLKLWEEADVDYRADAQRAMIAAPDAQHVWVATDTGIILAPEQKHVEKPAAE
jgi:hypothetical protein